MSRDDYDDSSIAGVFALAAIIGSSQAEYVKDLVGSIRQIFGHGGLEVALREDRARVKANVLALAVIADGTVSSAERAALEGFCAKHGIDADEAIAKVATLVEEVRDPAVLRDHVARSAAELYSDERLELFVAVKNLAHGGSRAWPSDAAYRGAAPTPEALVAIFREALGIESTES